MAVTDWKYAGTAANVDRDAKTAWTDPDYAKAADTNYTTNNLGKGAYGDWLQVTNFGFTSSDLPSGCTINGIEFIIKRQGSTQNEVSDSALYLRKTSGQVGNNLASASKYNYVQLEDATYGGSTDMCGTSLSQSDIVSTDFGLDFSSTTATKYGNAIVDYIKIRVYYTAGGSSVKPYYYYLNQ